MRQRGRRALPPFEEFFQTQKDLVWRFLAGSVGAADADDCFQETFIAALRAYPALDAEANLRAWVLTIARHKAIDHYRARARRPEPTDQLDHRLAAQLAEQDDRAVWRLVQELPDKQRAAVVLRFVGDLTHAEIASVLEMSAEAARQNLHQGLKALRRRSDVPDAPLPA